jgi:hypothetical protein
MAKTITHIIKNNDHLPFLSELCGFEDWRSLWQQNPSLHSKRKNPLILYHGNKYTQGDTLTIKPPEEKKVSGAVDAHHPFKTRTDQVYLKLRVVDDKLEPLSADTKYELFVDGRKLTGNLDANGMLSVPVSRGAQRGKLVIQYPVKLEPRPEDTWPNVIKGVPGDSGTMEGVTPAGTGETPVEPGKEEATPSESEPDPTTDEDAVAEIAVVFQLEIGRLDPIQESAPDKRCLSGVQQRLNNLGFDAGPVDGIDGPLTKGGVKRFQRRFKLDVDGIAGPITQGALYDFHDQPGRAPAEAEETESGTPSSSPGTPPAAAPAPAPGDGDSTEDDKHPTGPEVLAVAREWNGGTYATKPDGTGFEGRGVSTDQVFKDVTVMKKDPQGRVHCVGYTYMVFLEVGTRYKLLEEKSADDLKLGSKFQQTWYCWGGSGPSEGCAKALVNLGVATLINDPEDAQAGDFCQIWRGTGNSGHSVIFLDWMREGDKPDGKRVGIKYRSAQTATGVADSQEKFTGHGGKVNPDRLTLARLTPK